MHTLIFDRHKISLEYENHCIIIRQPDTPPRSIPLTHVRKIICLHSVQLTTSLLGQLWQRKIDFITLNSRYSERSFALFPNQQQQVERRCIQYTWQQQEALCLALASALCQHRVTCNIRLLSGRCTEQLLAALHASHHAMADCQTLNQLRGIEGAIQRQIFEHWRQQLPTELGFNQRVRRPPTDPVNAILSLTYTLALQEGIRQCTAVGLDSQLGVYHRTVLGRHSLACDLIEPVRPACEQWVMQCFIDKTLDARHFTRSDGKPCLLGKRGREIFYQTIEPHLQIWQRQLKATAHWLSRNIDLRLTGAAYEKDAALVPHSV